MNLHLIKGVFDKNDAIDIITQMVNVKIKYHENKIAAHISEEDIKSRESKIRKLQQELSDFRKSVQVGTNSLKIEAEIRVEQ